MRELTILNKYTLWTLLLAGSSLAATDPRLIEAVKDDNPKAVSSLIDQHADVNAKQPDGATPLAWAVYLNQTNTVELLMKAGANVNTADEYGETPLTLACANGNAAIVEKLLKAGADATAARWDGETALMLAARSGSVEAVKLLLAKGAPNTAMIDSVESRKGQNALMWAAAEGHSDVVDVLIRNKANVNTASKAGFTPMIFAAQKGDAKSVASLLAAGVDPNYALPNGMNALHLAAIGGKTEVAEILLDKGANANAKDRTQNTALHTAAQAGNLELVKKLLTKGADPNSRTAKTNPNAGPQFGPFRAPAGEQTPVLLAAKGNHEDVLRALVEAGGDPKLKAQDGATLLMAAVGSGHVEIVKYAYGLDPDVKPVTDTGTTLMHAAVTGTTQTATQAQVCEVVQFLADKGAPLDEKNARGRTPIDIADILPIDKAVDLLTQLILKSGATPKTLTKR